MPARAHAIQRPFVPLLQADDQIRTCYEHTMAEWLGCEAIVRQREKESHAAALAKCSSGASLDSHIQRMMHRDSTISNEVRVRRLKRAVSMLQGNGSLQPVGPGRGQQPQSCGASLGVPGVCVMQEKGREGSVPGVTLRRSGLWVGTAVALQIVPILVASPLWFWLCAHCLYGERVLGGELAVNTCQNSPFSPLNVKFPAVKRSHGNGGKLSPFLSLPESHNVRVGTAPAAALKAVCFLKTPIVSV